MFEARQLVFYYAVTPVHMGAGSAIGAIDSPIQREVHTQHPMFAGAGLKGALRHHFSQSWTGEKDKKNAGLINRIFGPDTGASDFAGALSLTDAQLVALPVRSLKGGFAWVTSPVALARMARLAGISKTESDWTDQDIPRPKESDGKDAAEAHVVAGSEAVRNDQLILEAFEFKAVSNEKLKTIADWLSRNALTADNAYFAGKLKTDLVVLSDTDFAHFARHAMVVEPHVRINDESGTADDGGLFYVENLPPESILVGLAQASIERYKKDERDKVADRMDDAQRVLDAVLKGTETLPGIHGKPLQIGGDASTGRGLVLVKAVGDEK